MGYSKLAVCTLGLVATGDLAARASESPPKPEPKPDKAEVDPVAIAPSVTPETAPVALAEPAFAEPEVKPEAEFVARAEPVPAEAVPDIPSDDVSLAAATANPKAEPSVLAASDRAGDLASAGSIEPPALETASENNCRLMAQRGDRCPRPQPIAPLEIPEIESDGEASPALSIYIPVGFGADNNTLFASTTYQASVREDPGSVATGGIGIGLGDAREGVGVEVSYAFETVDEFGPGGFNAKLHRRFGRDWSAAVGWNGFLNPSRNDFEHSFYGTVTAVARTRESIRQPFSRVAFTAGTGLNQFRSNGSVDAGENNFNVFGNVAVRVARPVSAIVEWTGQDLAAGLSVTPFRDLPITITPALRDIAGAGDGARFVLGVGTAFQL